MTSELLIRFLLIFGVHFLLFFFVILFFAILVFGFLKLFIKN